jgi:hypothetical protein
VLPGRLGVRFALEALFIVLVAVGAGLADLRPALIVLVVAIAWVLVALIEFTAERIARTPSSYLLPTPSAEEEEPQRIFWPRPEERTVVAPPEQPPAEETAESAEQPPELAQADDQREPEVEEEPAPQAPSSRRRMRALFRRRQRELESAPPVPPRHVKRLPRREAPEPSRAAREVAELFGPGDDVDRRKREEGGG